ncbi:MAG: Sec-independent protein translocase subunit TatA/TatB [Gemmatimonadaceae bacterium]
MGNFSFWEIFLIFIVVLLLFGAKRIPEIAGSMGKGIREFKKSINEVERAIQEPERPGTRLPKEEARERPVVAAAEAEPERPEPKRLLS